MNYWLTVFNEATWQQFCDMDPKVCAYDDPPFKRFPTIDIDDRIVCYIAKKQTWAGILRVVGEKFRDDTRIYQGGVFPNRIPVTPEIVITDVDAAVPMPSLEGRLSFFPNGGTGKNWGPYMRNSPRKLYAPDAEAIIDSVTLRKAA